jgi:hypothetical protein
MLIKHPSFQKVCVMSHGISPSILMEIDVCRYDQKESC